MSAIDSACLSNDIRGDGVGMGTPECPGGPIIHMNPPKQIQEEHDGLAVAPRAPLAYEPNLDGLRALAVLAVLAFHLDIAVFHGGFIGVDIFYVISGYLITRIVSTQIDTGLFNYVDFIVRRARRLLPALLVTIAATLFGAFLLMSPSHFSGAAKSAAFAAFSISNWFFWIDSDYFASSKHVRPLLHTWSLGVEVQFYVLWPCVLYTVMKVRDHALQILLMTGFAFVSFAGAVWAHAASPSATFYLSPFRIWQFAAGGCVGLLAATTLANLHKYLHWSAFALGLLLIASSLTLLSPHNYRSLSAVLPTIGTCLLIVGLGAAPARFILGHSGAVYIGRISYSLYLTHWPVIILYRYWVYRPLEPIEMIGCAAFSFLSAVLLHHFVETRFRRPWASQKNSERVAVGSRLIISMTALAAIASLIPLKQGWDWRLPENNRAAQVFQTAHFPCGNSPSLHSETGCEFMNSERLDNHLVILGDSHALALARGLEQTRAAENTRATLIARYGTLPFHGVTTYGGKWKAGDFGDTFEHLATTSPDMIVLHARFDQYWWSEDADTNYPTWIGKGSQSPQATLPSQAAFISGLDATLDRFNASKAKVVLVGAVPYPGLDSSQCLLRPQYLLTDEQLDQSCAGYSRDASMYRAGAVNEIIRAKAEAAGFLFVDPIDLFCSEDTPTCTRIHDGKVIYSDGDHLNQVGSEILARAVWQALKLDD